MLLSGVLFFVILFMIEFRVFHRLFYMCKRTPHQRMLPDDGTGVDSDVMEEKFRVRNMNYNQLRANNLLVRNMSKYYGSFLAVNDICVGVDA